jgi:oxygen-independent coproporphyrinogen-3 oxidase
MELPFNTVYTKQLRDGDMEIPVADWRTKREWQHYAFEELAAAGYEISSAYTMVKSKECKFVYRDSVWYGTDMIGAGVASFGHMNHVHMQNTPSWNDYLGLLQKGTLPVTRAFPTSEKERVTREVLLQLKLGHITPRYFQKKFGVDIIHAFRPAFEELKREGMLTFDQDNVVLTRQGFLQVDSLLPEFYAPKYRDARYT